jgi:flavin-dependent dehydrogenase
VGAQVVGADGAYSLVNRTFGVARPRAVATAVEVELGGAAVAAAPPPVARFDFGAVERGYGWVFPKGDRWNVGLYTFATGLRDLRGRLAAYLRAAGFAVRGDPLATCAAHRIPVGGYRLAAPGAPLYLVGDAAGLADALTGEGLYHALASGRLAGATAGAVAAGRAAPGAYYARLWRAVLPDTWLSYRLAGAVYRHPAAAMGLLASPAVGRPLVEGAAAGATFAQSVARAGPYLARSLRAGALARQRLAPAGRAR